VENNVVAWVLKNAQVKKELISFENLMGRGQQA
jgi:trigger factor